MKKVAVIMAGCGFKDGGEIHENTLTLLALNLAGAQYQCAAPSIPQFQVVDHVTAQRVAETRNVMVEAARIARGNIVDVRELRVADYDAVVVPGGFGAANNLSSFAREGAAMKVDPGVAEFLIGMHKAGKPIGAICIAPPLAAWTLKQCGVTGADITIGNDPGTAAKIRELGQNHVDCPATDCVVDRRHKVVTTPAYMTAKSIGELWTGIQRTIEELLKL